MDARNGFGLQFFRNSTVEQMLEYVLPSNWDGCNVYEGLIIFAVTESIVDF